MSAHGRRRGCHAVIAALLSLALLLAGRATALPLPPDTGTITEYDVRFGPLRLLSMRATVVLDGQRYRASSEMETVGVVSLLFPWHAAVSTEGLMRADHLQPVQHRGSGELRGQRRAVVIDYDDAGVVDAVVEPTSEDEARDAVPAALRQRTVDPLTATMAAIAFQCHGTLPVFDGRRRYDMHLEDLGTTDTPSNADGLYRGPARRCRARIEPLAGFWRATPQQDERPTQLDAWVAAPRADLPPVPVYLELSGARGTIAVNLRSLAPAPITGSP